MTRIAIFTSNLMTPGGSSRKACLIAERLSRTQDVWLISRDVTDRAQLARNFGTPLANVQLLTLGQTASPAVRALRRALQLFPDHIQAILTQVPDYHQLRRLRADLFILNDSFHQMHCPAPRGLFMCMFAWPTPKFPRARWCHWPVVKPIIRRLLANTLTRDPFAVKSYDVLTANSEFTAHWIKQRWNRDARVIYSASDVTRHHLSEQRHAGGSRRRVLLCVARYNWDKQQHVLLEGFRSLPDLWAEGWELHFVGEVHASSVPYHQQLLKQAEGMPVRFHYSATAEQLREHYARSSMLWLAKGFGVPPHEPERMEHFGNTPLEAMSLGCVPVVFDGGGLRETVQHGSNGFRWQTQEQLCSHTRTLAANPELLLRLRDNGLRIHPKFGVEPFLASVEHIVQEMLSGS